MTQTDQLSEREKEVVGLLLQGKSNKQIALALGISERTVEFHLKNVYAKLQVSSRTEAILRLGKSTGGEPVESAVAGTGENADNDGKPISTRRLPMKKALSIAGVVLLTTVLAVMLIVTNIPAQDADILPSPTVGMTEIPATTIPTITPQPTVSPKEHLLEQVRQLAAEYDQSVQAEKKNGKVEFSKDPKTGEDIFVFKDQSYLTMSELYTQFLQEKTRLEQYYTQLYRNEAHPTPFPTQASLKQNQAYYETLAGQADPFCALEAWQNDPQAEKVMAYDPDEGKYKAIFMGVVIARCEIYGQMLEELRLSPWLAQVDQAADLATIRQITGKPDLQLSFQTIRNLANAPGRNTALYTDEIGTKYYVDVETSRLAQIEPNFPSHPDIATSETKSLDELRGIAGQFALTNSPRLAELKPVLQYEEGGKTNIYFFTWSYRNKDWSGTDWARMPPFIQVGVLTNGQIATYINTLDLFK